MDNTSAIALSRLTADQRSIDVIAANIANADTPGYRAERVQFSDWLVREPDGSEPRGGNTLIFTQDRATWHDQTPGTLTHTGNPLDLAIGSTDGWFTLMTANGPRLSRAGHFMMSADGTVVDPDGNALLDTQGEKLTLPPDASDIGVAGDGTVTASGSQVGTVGVVRPDSTAGMSAEGGRLYALPAGDATQPQAAPRLVQGAVEDSNVQPVAELTRMLDTERRFQFATQFVQSESDRQQAAIDKILPARS